MVQILERDIAFISIVDVDSSSMQAAGVGKAEAAKEPCLHVNLSVCAADVQDAQQVAVRMAAPEFAATVSPPKHAPLEEAQRTIDKAQVSTDLF